MPNNHTQHTHESNNFQNLDFSNNYNQKANSSYLLEQKESEHGI